MDTVTVNVGVFLMLTTQQFADMRAMHSYCNISEVLAREMLG